MNRTTTPETVSVRTVSRARLFGSPFHESWSVSRMDAKTGRPREFMEVRPGKRAGS